MPIVNVRFYAELNDTLPPEIRAREFPVAIGDGATVRGVLAGFGMMPERIDLVLLNGISTGLDTPVHDMDRVSFYPVFESFDITNLTRVRPVPLRSPRFVCDVHLGKLASLLRMLGFDTMYTSHYADATLIDISLTQDRTLLSMDRALVHQPALTRAQRILSPHPREQLMETIRRFDLSGCLHPFTRCTLCNESLEEIPKGAVEHRLPPGVRETYEEFFHCRNCDRVYWKGSHYEKMEAYIRTLLDDLRQSDDVFS